MKQAATAVCPQKRTDALVRVLAAEAFLVLIQAYMVAPLIPSLAVGLSACILFLGYGTGAFIFQPLNTGGLHLPFEVFGSFELLSGILAFWIFRHFR